MKTPLMVSLDPSTYVNHRLHRGERAWLETNCYVDVWIELLHALGHEPLAAMAFTVRTDLESDQWTFFKFQHEDLYRLYGIEVKELNLWWSTLEQTESEVRAGRPVILEMDAWYLPDTRGTSYQTAHVKTSIAVLSVDADARRLGYFHNTGYHTLTGDDFDAVFRLDPTRFGPEHLAPYAEVVCCEAGQPLRGSELASSSLDSLAEHLRRAPASNPFERQQARFATELAQLQESGPDRFHAYAFATFRQIGASFELAGDYLDWLSPHTSASFSPARDAFSSISTTAKTLQLRVARSALAKKSLDAAPHFEAMASAWETAMRVLRDTVG